MLFSCCCCSNSRFSVGAGLEVFFRSGLDTAQGGLVEHGGGYGAVFCGSGGCLRRCGAGIGIK